MSESKAKLTEEFKKQLEMQEYHDKNVAYYSALINAWISTKTDITKNIITLSTAGLGVLITLATSIGLETTLEFHFFILSTISFAVTITLSIITFHCNCKQIKLILDEKTGIDKLLKVMKYTYNSLFMISIFLVIALSILIVFRNLEV